MERAEAARAGGGGEEGGGLLAHQKRFSVREYHREGGGGGGVDMAVVVDTAVEGSGAVDGLAGDDDDTAPVSRGTEEMVQPLSTHMQPHLFGCAPACGGLSRPFSPQGARHRRRRRRCLMLPRTLISLVSRRRRRRRRPSWATRPRGCTSTRPGSPSSTRCRPL